MKKLFLLDIKKLDENLEGIDRPVEKLLKRYELNIGDYETCEFSEAIFIRLGWSNKYKDTIFSFRTIFCKIIEIYSEIYSEDKELKFKNGKKIKYYFRNNTLKYKIDGESPDKYSYTKARLYNKAIYDENCILKILFDKIKKEDIYKKLEEVAKLLDSLSNFTPHPGYPFNQAKGCLSNLADSLNLMIDKVQKCICDGDGLKYGNKENEIIELEKLKIWKKWFIDNRSVYCLDELYSIDNGEIKGKKFFTGQSLSKPLPKDEKEMDEYLDSIIGFLLRRAEMMDKSLH